MDKQTLRSQFNIVSYADALKNQPQTAIEFEKWVHDLRPETSGGETGYGPTGTLGWIYYHAPEQEEGGLFQTLIFTDKQNGKIIATATIVPDDRDIGKKYEIGQDAFLGFVQVDKDHRNKGVGTYVCETMDEHVMDWLSRHPEKKALRIALFTGDDAAQHIYKKLGYAFEKPVFIADFNATACLFGKTVSAKPATQELV